MHRSLGGAGGFACRSVLLSLLAGRRNRLPTWPAIEGTKLKRGGKIPPRSQIDFFLPARALPPAATTAAAISAATAALFLRTGHIDVQSPAVDFAAIQSGDRLIALAVVAHLHESKALGSSGFAVGYDIDTVNCAVRCKERSNCIFRSLKAEISNKNIFHGNFSFLKFAEQQIEGTG